MRMATAMQVKLEHVQQVPMPKTEEEDDDKKEDEAKKVKKDVSQFPCTLACSIDIYCYPRR